MQIIVYSHLLLLRVVSIYGIVLVALHTCTWLILIDYSRHLSQHLPKSQATVPLSVQLSVPAREFKAQDVVLLPEDNMANVLTKLRAAMDAAGLEVDSFPPCEEFEVSIIR